MATFLLRVALSWILLVLALPMEATEHDSIITPPKNVSGSLGGTAKFKCEVEFSDIVMLAWEFSNQIIYSLQYGKEDYPKGNVKYFVAKEGGTFTLRINDLQYEDSGIYTCRVLDEARDATLNVTDTVEHRSIITPPKDVTGQLGGMAHFKCEVDFISIPVMEWEFNHKIIYSITFEDEDYPLGTAKYSVTKDGGTFTLTVMDIHYRDAGKYTCRVLDEAEEANLNVKEVQESFIVTPPSDATGKLGGTAEFSCKVQFASIKVMRWEFNQEAIYTLEFDHEGFPKGQSKYSVVREGRTFNLTVKDLQYSDSGVYTCRVHEKAGLANLIVAGTPKLSTSTSNPVEGSTAKYTCFAPFTGHRKEVIASDHYPRLLMFIDGELLNGTVTEEHVGSEIIYYKLTQNYTLTLEAGMHGKILTCVIRTSKPAMKLENATKLTVFYPVRNIKYTPNRATYKNGTVINCTADGNPQPYFQWNKTNTGNVMLMVNGSSLKIVEGMVGNNSWVCTARNTVNGRTHEESVVARFSVEAVSDKETESGTVLHEETESKTDSWKIAVSVTIPVCLLIGCLTAWFCHLRFRKSRVGDPQRDDGTALLDVPNGITAADQGSQQGKPDEIRSAQLMSVIADLECEENISEDIVKQVRELSPNQKVLDNTQPALLVLKIAKDILFSDCKTLKDQNGETALHKVSSLAHIWKNYPKELYVVFKSLSIDQGANAINKQGDSALHVFTSKAGKWRNHTETFLRIVKLLLSHENVDIQNELGSTALHEFTKCANEWKEQHQAFLEVAGHLKNSNNIDLQNNAGDTALHLFISQAGKWTDHPEAFLRIVTILSSSRNADTKNITSETALHVFTESAGEWTEQHQEFLKVAGHLDVSENIDLQNGIGNTPLHMFISQAGIWKDQPKYFLEVVKFLATPTNMDMQNYAEDTALHLFISVAGEWKPKQFLDVVKSLKTLINIDMRTFEGETALHLFTYMGVKWKWNSDTFIEVINMLKSSENIEIRNNGGATPLHAFVDNAGAWKDCPDPFLEVVQCLQSPTNTDLVNEKKDSALHTFIDKAHDWKGCSKTFSAVVKRLKSDTNIDFRNYEGKTALNVFMCNYADWKYCPEVFLDVITFLKSPNNVNITNNFGETALQVFISRAHEWKDHPLYFYDIVKCLISQTNVDISNDKGATAMHSFIETSCEMKNHPGLYLEIIISLKSRSNIDMQNEEGATALHLFTSQAGEWKYQPRTFLEVVNFLKTNKNIDMIKKSAGKNQNSKGETALHLFTSRAGEWRGNPVNFLEVVKTLKSQKNIDMQNNEDATALHTFTDKLGEWKDHPKEFLDVVKYLKSTANMNMVTSTGETVLHIIISKALNWVDHHGKLVEVVECLRSSSNIERKNSENQTAMEIFTKMTNQWKDYPNVFLGIVRCLKSSENIYDTDNNNETALTNFTVWENTWREHPTEFMKVVRCLITKTSDENMTEDGLVFELISWAKYWIGQKDIRSIEVLKLLSSPTIMHFGPENGIKLLGDLCALFEENVGWKDMPSQTQNKWQYCYMKTVENFASHWLGHMNKEEARPLHVFTARSDCWVDYPRTFLSVVKFLKSYTDINATDKYRRTALHIFTPWAYNWTKHPQIYLEVIKALCTATNIDMQDAWGSTALHSFTYDTAKWADRAEYFSKVVDCLFSQRNINIQKINGISALHDFLSGARAWGDHPNLFLTIFRCLKSSTNINFCDADGNTALHYLFQSIINRKDRSPETICAEIRRFLRLDDDIDMDIVEGTAEGLMYICNVKIFDTQLVLDIITRNMSHNTQVKHNNGRKEIRIFESGTRKWEDSPKLFLEVVTELVSPTNINYHNVDGETPLHRFARCSRKWADHVEETSDILNRLVSPENMSMQNNSGKTPRDLFEENWGESAKPFLKILTPVETFQN